MTTRRIVVALLLLAIAAFLVIEFGFGTPARGRGEPVPAAGNERLQVAGGLRSAKTRPVEDESTAPADDVEPGPQTTWTGIVHGVVRGEGGQAAADAVTVEVLDANADRARVRAVGAPEGETGRFRVTLQLAETNRTFWVRARCDAGPTMSSRHALTLDRRRAGSAPPLVLVLRRSLKVRGRVINDAGEPAAGAQIRIASDGYAPARRCCSGESSVQEHAAVAGPDGQFSTRIRPGRFVIAATGDAGVWSEMRSFADSPAPIVDVGDIVAPSSEISTWTLRVVDPDGAPVIDALVKVGRHGQWNMREHDAFEEARYVVRLDESGEIVLRFPRQPGHVFLGVGGPRHVTRAIALDCRVADARTESIVLQRRRGVRITLTGPGAPLAIAAGAGVQVHPIDQQRLSHEREAFDPTAQVTVPVQPVPGWIPPAYSLEGWMTELGGVERVGPGRFSHRATHEGGHTAELHIGPIQIASLEFQPADSPQATELELHVPAGRVIELSLGDLAESDFPGGRRAWVSRYSAWPYVRDIRQDDAGAVHDAGLRDISAWVDPYEQIELTAEGSVSFWLPANERIDAIAFGLLEQTSEGRPIAVRPETVRYVPVGTLSADEPTVLAAPRFDADRVDATSVAFSVQRDGRTLPMGGIPLVVSRVAGRGDDSGPCLRGNTKIRTDETGRAAARLLPGAYAVVGVGGGVGGRTFFDVPSGVATLAVEVEVGE